LNRRYRMPGYPNKFVDKVRKRHQCPLCHLPMRDPVQITACRHRYCDTCLQSFLGEGVFNCPVDHLSLDYAKVIYPDPDLDNEIMSLTTHCSNYSSGCKWTGKLHNLKAHIDKCSYSERECPNRCGARLRSMKLADHLEYECLKRRVTCDFSFIFDVQTHHGTCSRYPIGCPNRCDVLKIPREELEVHLKEHCKSALTICPFKEAGCKHKAMFDLVKTQRNHITELQKQLSDLTVNTNGTLLWKIPGYSQKLQAAQKEKAIEMRSPPFYTHRYGYKLQLSAFLNGNGSGLNSHMSLYIRVLPGEYDSLLEWPFSHDITFNILDQGDPLSSKRSHISVRFTPDPTWKNFQQPTTDPNDDSTLGFGYPKFVSHKELKDNCYLKGNSLFIKAVVDTSR
uniref:TNF receptor-associated factor n=1 Tax=Ciona savignyi TaxID=51511 RepID=H2YUF4_CIOSA